MTAGIKMKEEIKNFVLITILILFLVTTIFLGYKAFIEPNNYESCYDGCYKAVICDDWATTDYCVGSSNYCVDMCEVKYGE